MPEPVYVYVLWAQGTNRIKIGYSQDVQQRIRQLQTGCPFLLTLVMAVPCVHAEMVEMRLHERFRDARSHNEWFLLPDDTTSAMDMLVIANEYMREDRPPGPPPRPPSPLTMFMEEVFVMIRDEGRPMMQVELIERTNPLALRYNCPGGIFHALDVLVQKGRLQCRAVMVLPKQDEYPYREYKSYEYWYERTSEDDDAWLALNLPMEETHD